MKKMNRDSLHFDYNWNDILKTEGQENDNIDLLNGYEVLRFINMFFDDHNLSSYRSYEKIERLLQKAPKQIIVKKELYSWLRKHWAMDTAITLIKPSRVNIKTN